MINGQSRLLPCLQTGLLNGFIGHDLSDSQRNCHEPRHRVSGHRVLLGPDVTSGRVHLADAIDEANGNNLDCFIATTATRIRGDWMSALRT